MNCQTLSKKARAWKPSCSLAVSLSLGFYSMGNTGLFMENQPQNTGKDLRSASHDHLQSHNFWDGGSFRADSAAITYRATPV